MSAGTSRPVLKSITRTRSSPMHSGRPCRRPPGRRARSRRSAPRPASPGRTGRQIAGSAISRAGRARRFPRPSLALHPCPLEPAQRQRHGGRRRRRRAAVRTANGASVPRRAASRISGLGGGAASRSSTICDGASGRGGRASTGAGCRSQSGMAIGSSRGLRGLARRQRPALAFPHEALAPALDLDRSSAERCIARHAAACQLACGTSRFGLTPAMTSRSAARVRPT